LAIAIAAERTHSVLEAGLTIGSIPAGALLGVFLLGVLTQRPRERAAMAGVVAGLATIVLVIWRTRIAFTWYVLIGTAATFAVGLAASWFEGPPPEPPEEVLVRQPSGRLPYRPSESARRPLPDET
jgi:Na+/proline symporter